MGLWETLTGRRAPRRPRLDSLFAIPTAAITLETAAGLRPTGSGSVCFRAAAGAAFAATQADIVDLLRQDPEAPDAEQVTDAFGFTWLTVQRDPSDMGGLCTDLHTVNVLLEEQGFGPSLLCSLVPFSDGAGRTVALVYLYKQGTFYPFAQAGADRRDNLLEMSVRDHLRGELPMEEDLQRWLAVWGAPGL
ncbi:hypothetical protein [Nocardioides sp.]|uniref:PspA-associated protein PspAB n=1 Tax=Nocardioides sp. TaxID=35761 RepID=UPI0027376B62|nr:hypothetical protein [Nocardioides sp.]MDP3892436.1 hypothetical protein [Nocardioides sp.]